MIQYPDISITIAVFYTEIHFTHHNNSYAIKYGTIRYWPWVHSCKFMLTIYNQCQTKQIEYTCTLTHKHSNHIGSHCIALHQYGMLWYELTILTKKVTKKKNCSHGHNKTKNQCIFAHLITKLIVTKFILPGIVGSAFGGNSIIFRWCHFNCAAFTSWHYSVGREFENENCTQTSLHLNRNADTHTGQRFDVNSAKIERNVRIT